MKAAQSCLTFGDPRDYTVHGILQARILEWVAFPFSRGSSQLRDRTQVSRIAGRFFTCWATGEANNAKGKIISGNCLRVRYPRLISDTKKSLISVPQLQTKKGLSWFSSPTPTSTPRVGMPRPQESYWGEIQRRRDWHSSGIVQAPVCQMVEE